MKLKWIETDLDRWAARVSDGAHIEISMVSDSDWGWWLCTENWCDYVASGRFRAKDLDAAKFEAVERALMWARKLVDRLESVT